MILALLKERFARAIAPLTDDLAATLDMIRPSQDAKFGDFQANMAMPLGKRLGKPPREVAGMILERLDLADLCEPPEIAGPGFINLRLRNTSLTTLLVGCLADEERLGVPMLSSEQRRRIVVDYSGPNVAKEMHVGHLRSTVIGNALQRMLRFLGHEVITDNHIGDWGTPFGMIIYGYRHFLDAVAFETAPVAELGRLYRHVRKLVDAEGDNGPLGRAVLDEIAKLHKNDPENMALWRMIVTHCMSDIERLYRRFGVTFDHTLGESFYNPMLGPLVDDLLRRGIARESDGAVGIFFEGDEVPMLIRKSDGAFLYGTTDLATIEYRMKEWKPDAMLYLTDFRQSLHFKHLFQAARLMGYDEQTLELAHVKFGTVLGEDGKPFKTRSGDTVGLESLLDEAEERALAVVVANDTERKLSDTERRETARRIGIGALVYADLSQNRESDYVFSYDKMLAMNGNTATYMQYAYARVCSIFSKGGIDPIALRHSGATIAFDHPAERSLALALLRFGESLEIALRDYRPNLLTGYLFELANRYSTFFDACPVLKADDSQSRTSRLLLCDLTARTIAKGLELLGIETVERM